VLIGKDTRISGYMLEAAMESGFSAAGVDTYLVGPMPTPGVAFLTRALRLSAGVMISASHNHFEDNGIKFFSADGMKLPDAVESDIEALLEQPLTLPSTSAQLGKAERVNDADGRYLEFCKGNFPKNLSLRGLRLIVDLREWRELPRGGCACSRSWGAEVIAVASQPNGTNINEDCGATVPRTWRARVLAASRRFRHRLRRRRRPARDGRSRRNDLRRRPASLRDGEAPPRAGAPRRRRGWNADDQLRARAPLQEMGVAFARAKVGDRYVLEMLLEENGDAGAKTPGTCFVSTATAPATGSFPRSRFSPRSSRPASRCANTRASWSCCRRCW
jgi:phosphoglucosamine mutase